MPKNARTTYSMIAFGGAFLLMASLLVAGPAAAQGSSIPAGATCERFDLSPTPAVTSPSDRDLVVLVLEDGTEVSFTDVSTGQRLASPTASPIVIMFKCHLPAAPGSDTGTPSEGGDDDTSSEPSPTPDAGTPDTPDTDTPDTDTPDSETPDTEAPDTPDAGTPDTEAPDTPDAGAPGPETPGEGTETPEAETPDDEGSTPDVTVLPVPEESPTVEVLPSVVEAEELALTGAESSWLAVVGLTLLASGGVLLGGSVAAARRRPTD